MANSRKKISELPALSVASLDTTFVLGISGSTTYKISINNLTSSLDGAFATDLVTNALSSSLNSKLSTSSFNSYTSSFTASVASGTISGSQQISDLGFVTGSYTTINSFNSLTQSFNSISQSFNVISGSVVSIQGGFDTGSYQTFTTSVNTSISNLNTFTASQSTSSLVNRLNTIESVSGSWITESETGSFLTSLSGAISSSSQLTSSYDTRYTLSGSILTSFSTSVDSRLDNLEAEISSSVSYAYITYITEPEVPNNDANGFLKPDGNISGSISYNQSTGYFTLLAGKTYKLRAVVNTTGGAAAFSPDWDLQWKDVTNNNFIGKQSIYSGDGEAFAIITPNTNIQVGLRSLSNTENGHPYIIKNSTFFFIEEMALGIVEGITGSTDYTQITNKPTLISGSSQLTSSYDTRYVISGSVGATPSGTISGSAQITAFGFVSGSYETTGRGIISSSANLVTTSSYNADSASFDSRINSIVTESGSNLTYFIEAYANVTYTLPGGFTEDICRYSVVSDTENVPSNWFNTSTYTFTPQKAGYWEIAAAYDVYRNTEASMAIRKNGSIVASAGSFNAVAQDISKIIYLNGSTDYIDIVNTGGAALQRNQYQQRSWFQAKFVGNISGSTDLLSANNTFTGTNVFSGSTTLRGAVAIGASSGDEGGEINLAYAQTTSLTGSALNFDVYQDRLRIFEGGGNNRGAYLNVASQSNSVSSEILTTSSTKILATPAWTSAGAITLTATTTNPTKGVTAQDNISYRQLGAKEWEIVMTYNQSANTGYVQGSGDYLITLPNGLSFDTTLPSQPIWTGNIGANSYAHFPNIIPNAGGFITNLSVAGQIWPMVYSATKFRILSYTIGSGTLCWGSGFYSTIDIPKIQLSFRFTST